MKRGLEAIEVLGYIREKIKVSPLTEAWNVISMSPLSLHLNKEDMYPKEIAAGLYVTICMTRIHGAFNY